MKLKIDSLHYALLAVVVLLAVYAFGFFKEGALDFEKGVRAQVERGGKRIDNPKKILIPLLTVAKHT